MAQAPGVPRRSPLPSAQTEADTDNGNAPRPDHRTEHATQADRTERVVMETLETVGLLARDQAGTRRLVERLQGDHELHRGETRRLADSVALISANAHAPRAPMPSFSSLFDDEEHKVITRNGTERLTYTQEQIVSMARTEYLRLEQEAQQARDAAPVAFVRAKLVPAVALKVGQVGALAAAGWVLHVLLSHLHL